jgi:hypothetical protein
MSSPRAFHCRWLRELINGCVALYCLLNVCCGSLLNLGAIYWKFNIPLANPYVRVLIVIFLIQEKMYHVAWMMSPFWTDQPWYGFSCCVRVFCAAAQSSENLGFRLRFVEFMLTSREPNVWLLDLSVLIATYIFPGTYTHVGRKPRKCWILPIFRRFYQV